VTPEEYQEVEEAARITGSSTISDHLRRALFAEMRATDAALGEARGRGYAEARSLARDEVRALQAQLVQVRQAAASWQRRAVDLERNVAITSQRLVMAVSRVLWSAPRARAELTRIWACLGPADQQRILPAAAERILEELERIRDEVSSIRYTRERDAETLTNAAWLHRLLIGAGGELTPAALTAHQTIADAAWKAELSLYRRGHRSDGAAFDAWSSAMRSRWPFNPPLAPVDGPPPPPPEPPPLDSPAQVPIQGVG
jgi:hypothetical protein